MEHAQKNNSTPDFCDVKQNTGNTGGRMSQSRKRTYSDAFEMVFGIGMIFFPAVFRKSVTSMSTVSVKGVLEKQRQEKLKSSIGSVLSSNSCKKNMHESNMQTDSMSATDNSIRLYSSPSMVSYKLTT